MSIITLTENDYHEIAPDKTKEHKLDAAVKVDLKYIKEPFAKDINQTFKYLRDLDKRRNLDSNKIFKDLYNHGN